MGNTDPHYKINNGPPGMGPPLSHHQQQQYQQPPNMYNRPPYVQHQPHSPSNPPSSPGAAGRPYSTLVSQREQEHYAKMQGPAPEQPHHGPVPANRLVLVCSALVETS